MLAAQYHMLYAAQTRSIVARMVPNVIQKEDTVIEERMLLFLG